MTLFDPASLATTEASAGAEPAARTARPRRPRSSEKPGISRETCDDLAPAPQDAVRLRLLVSYDGSGFRGFAAQRGQRTVAGELSRAIATVARHEVELTCAGRTDAGVHAVGQVVHVDVRPDLEPERVAKAVNAMLGPSVVVRSAARAPEGFDARRSALSRRYRYLVLNAASPDPLLAGLAWHVRDQLDLRSMTAAADSLLGEHDFSAFCRRPPGVPAGQPIHRRVVDVRWTRSGYAEDHLTEGEQLLRFDIRAQSFCHQMVRSIVGTLVDVGRGRRRASDVTWLLATGDRSRAHAIAPPHALCLVGVEYPSVARPDR